MQSQTSIQKGMSHTASSLKSFETWKMIALITTFILATYIYADKDDVVEEQKEQAQTQALAEYVEWMKFDPDSVTDSSIVLNIVQQEILNQPMPPGSGGFSTTILDSILVNGRPFQHDSYVNMFRYLYGSENFEEMPTENALLSVCDFGDFKLMFNGEEYFVYTYGDELRIESRTYVGEQLGMSSDMEDVIERGVWCSISNGHVGLYSLDENVLVHFSGSNYTDIEIIDLSGHINSETIRHANSGQIQYQLTENFFMINDISGSLLIDLDTGIIERLEGVQLQSLTYVDEQLYAGFKTLNQSGYNYQFGERIKELQGAINLTTGEILFTIPYSEQTYDFISSFQHDGELYLTHMMLGRERGSHTRQQTILHYDDETNEVTELYAFRYDADEVDLYITSNYNGELGVSVWPLNVEEWVPNTIHRVSSVTDAIPIFEEAGAEVFYPGELGPESTENLLPSEAQR